MTPLFRTILIATVLSFCAGLGGAWLGVQLLSRTEPSLHALVHGEMKLSPAQQAKMDEAESRFTAKRDALEARIAETNRRLAQSMRESATYSRTVELSVNEVHVGLGELQKETIKYVYDMRAILTPDQAKRLDDRVFEALTHEH